MADTSVSTENELIGAPFSPALYGRAQALLALARERGLRVATAESCTGGLVGGLLTAVPGSSDVVEGGFITYSNKAKHTVLGVPEALLARFGAVSEPVARAMAEGVLAKLPTADVAVAVTGVAGPGGGSPEKPVGLVHFAAARRDGQVLHAVHRFTDDGRAAIRLRSVAAALALLEQIAGAPVAA
ncbi:MAG: CinA family protein [Pseudochelatococcus sp.]|jgi:nicotinamide-nucleotide amidase|uniref:CinA family protein n=1 Tax=Pseudochelatococcus sp. TaxID=2020869 RepID=UPI003D8A9BDA